MFGVTVRWLASERRAAWNLPTMAEAETWAQQLQAACRKSGTPVEIKVYPYAVDCDRINGLL